MKIIRIRAFIENDNTLPLHDIQSYKCIGQISYYFTFRVLTMNIRMREGYTF